MATPHQKSDSEKPQPKSGFNPIGGKLILADSSKQKKRPKGKRSFRLPISETKG